jgi:hypothetical protein
MAAVAISCDQSLKSEARPTPRTVRFSQPLDRFVVFFSGILPWNGAPLDCGGKRSATPLWDYAYFALRRMNNLQRNYNTSLLGGA